MADLGAFDSSVCSSEGCSNKGTMRCPKCVQLGIAPHLSTFCSQDCFKAFWGTHKTIHALMANASTANPVQHRGSAPEIRDGFDYRGPLRRKEGTPQRTVPPHIRKPDYADGGIPLSERLVRGQVERIPLFVPADIAKIRKAAQLAREVLDIAALSARPGVTTDELDRIVYEEAIARDCYPSALNYNKFPKSCCTSINEIICHGIPDGNELCDGDLLKLDVTLYYDGFHGDLCETYAIGNVSAEDRRLAQSTYDCLFDAIDAVKPGVPFREIGNIIQRRADADGFSVVKSYCGHGIGNLFHCAPSIPHYGKNKCAGFMKTGMVFSIEPMINAGTWKDHSWLDNWTSSTADGRKSCQFEHTMTVTDNGVEVLTARKADSRADFVRTPKQAAATSAK